MWGRKVRKYRFFFFLIVMMCLSLYDYQAKASRHRKDWPCLKNRATTNQNGTLHSQKLIGKVFKHKINGNHPTKKRKKEKRNIESTGKQGKMAINRLSINNHLKCQCTECSNQKTQSGRLDKKSKNLQSAAYKKLTLEQRTHIDSKWGVGKRYFTPIDKIGRQEFQYSK